MPRSAARLRVSIKDNTTRAGIKVELIEAHGRRDERRDRLRQNERVPGKAKWATLTAVFDGLRRWMVRRWPHSPSSVRSFFVSFATTRS